MCGIVAFTGVTDIQRDLLFGLRRLEYRGYDSFGFAFMTDQGLGLIRDVGPLSAKVAELAEHGMPPTRLGIGHTRWATHGKVTVANAHPHLSFDRRFAVVHNGVIDNHKSLKNELEKRGARFVSETDTEVVAHLLAIRFEELGSVEAAIRSLPASLSGEFALAIASTECPGLLYGLKRKSPLAVGVLDGAAFLSSDPTASTGRSGRIAFLEDGDIVTVRPDGFELFTETPGTKGGYQTVERALFEIGGEIDGDELGEHPHYMIKEIHEAAGAINRVPQMSAALFSDVVGQLAERNIALVGSGSAFYVSLMGQYFFNQIAGKYAICHPADEFLNLCPLSERETLLAISQSGETFDTLEVMRHAKSRGASLIAVNNAPQSTSQRLADFPIAQEAGREVCVLSTKSILSQAAILYRLAVELGERLGTQTPAETLQLKSDLQRLPDVMAGLIANQQAEIKRIGEAYRWIEHWFFLGRSLLYPVALESALKFKEVSYLHAEGMPAGFLKHGTISLIDEKFFTVAFIPSHATDPESHAFTLSSLHEIKARGGNIIGFGHDPVEAFEPEFFEAYEKLPSLSKYLDPILHLVAGELFAYSAAVKLRRNIDQPRALAKAVTVR